VGPYMTLGTLFEQNLISLPQGCFMPNINVFWPVVHENERTFLKIYQNFPYLAPKGGQSLYLKKNLNPHPPSIFPTNFG